MDSLSSNKVASEEVGPDHAASGEFAAFVKQTEVTLREALGRLDQPLLAEAAGHLCLGGGKRVRPRLVWAFAHCLSKPPPVTDLLDVGVSSELIHNGSLLHDDVIDHGTSRRGKATVNAQWGNTVAVLTGDLLLTQALVQMSRHPAQLTTEAAHTIAAMTRAAIAEVEARGRLDLDEAQWRRIAEGKTGRLFAWCGRAVAHLAGEPGAIARFDACGLRLGVGFQLADDLLDLIGERMGKDRYSDLKNLEASLPILLAVGEAPDLRQQVQQLWERGCPAGEVKRVGDLISGSAAVGRAVRLLESLVEDALQQLDGYRHTAGGQLIEQWSHQQLRHRIDARHLP